MPTRLANIQRANLRTRSRDLLFAAFVALAAVVSISALGTAVDAATQVASK